MRQAIARKISSNKKLQAYVVGLALGDGNLSNPNGRAVRLRITCDNKYTALFEAIKSSLQKLFPDNKVSVVSKKKSCKDISCYSNRLEKVLGWKSDKGSKLKQKVRIPEWIFKDDQYIKECLRGLLQTDGSVYIDREYKMVNFVSHIPTLSLDVLKGIKKLGYHANLQKLKVRNQTKHTIRISKGVDGFMKDINLWKK